MNLEQTLEYIHSNYWNGGTFGLGRMVQLLDLIGHPEKDLKFIHIAGTNGKGVVLTDFTVKVKEDKIEGPQISTENDVHWYYIASASTKSYCKDKVIYSDTETSYLRLGDTSFMADRIWGIS